MNATPARASMIEMLRRRELALLLASRAPMAERHEAERAGLQGVFDRACLDAEIVRRAPEFTLREHVRLMWARGVNPRVYMRFLPHGYEEREGLDFFGNDLRAKGTAG